MAAGKVGFDPGDPGRRNLIIEAGLEPGDEAAGANVARGCIEA
jgi:hypothetical protein